MEVICFVTTRGLCGVLKVEGSHAQRLEQQPNIVGKELVALAANDPRTSHRDHVLLNLEVLISFSNLLPGARREETGSEISILSTKYTCDYFLVITAWK